MDKSLAIFTAPNRLFTALLLVGAFFPTSLSGSISKPLYLAALGISVGLLLLCAICYGVSRKTLQYITLPIPCLLLLFTITSLMRFHFITLGLAILPMFCVLGFLYCLRLKECAPRKPEKLLAFVSLANLIIGTGVVAGNVAITNLLLNYYNNYLPELMGDMMAEHKPVLVYTTHSLAALLIYLFFWLNLRAYKVTGKRLHLFLAIAHIPLCLALFSHTSFVFSGVALIELAWLFFKRSPKLTVATVGVALCLIPIGLSEAVNAGYLFWTLNPGSGIVGRYGDTGAQSVQLNFLKSHILPIGLVDSEKINPLAIDSPPMYYMLCGSFPLIVLMYGGLWLFLRRNLSSRSDRYHLFFAILAAEVGILVLLQIRTLCLLPAFVMLLNGLRAPEERPSIWRRWIRHIRQNQLITETREC